MVKSAAYSPDGKQIVTASADQTARIWDAATGQEVRTLSGHTGSVNSAAYSPDGTQIVTASDDQTARIWDAATGQEVRTLSGHTDWVNSAAYSPGRHSRSSPPVPTRPPASGTPPRGRKCAPSAATPTPVWSAAYSPDGKQIVTASDDGTARIWDAATGQEVRHLSGHTGRCLVGGLQSGRQV